MEELLGIDWTPFISYIETQYPGAMPYLRAAFLLIPIVGWILTFMRKFLPTPGTQYPMVSDDELKGKISPRLFRLLNKWIMVYNQLLLICNWFCKTTIYSGIYRILTLFATGDVKEFFGKAEADLSKSITIPKPYDNTKDELPTPANTDKPGPKPTDPKTPAPPTDKAAS